MAPSEEAVGLQDAADLDQGAGQVVDPVQVHGAHDQVEALAARTAGAPRRPPPPDRARCGQSRSRDRLRTRQPTAARSRRAPWRFRRRASRDRGPAERCGARRPGARPGGSAISRLRKACAVPVARRAARAAGAARRGRKPAEDRGPSHGVCRAKARATGRGAAILSAHFAGLNGVMLPTRSGSRLCERRSRAARCGAAAALPGLQRDRRERRARSAPPAGRVSPSSRRRHCARCAYPFRRGSGRGRAVRGCLAARRRAIRRARAALVYDDAAAAAWSCRSSMATAPTLPAPAAAGWRGPAPSCWPSADLIAPVPLHWRRLLDAPLQPGAAAGPDRRRAAAARIRPGWLPTCCAGGGGPARRPGCSAKERRTQRPAGLRHPSALGWRRWPASPSCWSTTC